MTATLQTRHTVTSYDDDLHRLRSTITQMGALCESQLTAAMDAVAERDAEGAAAVVSLDSRVDDLHAEAENAAIAILARHAPLAEDLREVVATMKIAGWLERVGDYAKNSAKRAVLLASLDGGDAADLIVDLAAEAKRLLRQALDAYVDRDADRAATVVTGDQAVDGTYATTFGALLAFAETHHDALLTITHLQFVAKNLERIADQATNIAEQVGFAVTGHLVADRFGATAGRSDRE